MTMADDGDAQSDGWRTMGEATAEGGEVAYLRHAEVGVEENHATLRFAYRVTEECRRSATRECKPRDDVYTTALRR